MIYWSVCLDNFPQFIAREPMQSQIQKNVKNLGEDTEKLDHTMLSDREYQVMIMIATGKTVKEIADELSLSVKTISTHRARALKKMGMKNNAEFAYYAIKQGLVA